MEKRNIDFDLPVTEDQWAVIVRTAEELGPERGFRPEDSEPPEVRVLATADRAPAGWREWVARDDAYGASEQPVARFDFNGGSPYARIEPWAEPEEPGLLEPEVETFQRELERWVRGRWHELLDESGINYVRGHVPQS